MRGWELATGAAIGLLVGFVLWGWAADEPHSVLPSVTPRGAGSTSPDGAVVPAADSKRELARLREQLVRETVRRETLERELASREAAPAPAPGHAEPASGVSGEGSSKTRDVPDGWPDRRVLLQAGLAPSEIDELYERYETIELERLYIRDQATREGWIGKPRFRRSMQQLDARYRALGDEYGEETYDWILYASGRQNRIRVSRVMQGSVAEEVGLEAGDVILRYDDERIFDGATLQRGTTSGEAGDTVALDVLRDGERIRVYPPQGPLGITLDPIRVQPGPR